MVRRLCHLHRPLMQPNQRTDQITYSSSSTNYPQACLFRWERTKSFLLAAYVDESELRPLVVAPYYWVAMPEAVRQVETGRSHHSRILL